MGRLLESKGAPVIKLCKGYHRNRLFFSCKFASFAYCKKLTKVIKNIPVSKKTGIPVAVHTYRWAILKNVKIFFLNILLGTEKNSEKFDF